MCASVANLTKLAEKFSTLSFQPMANEMDGRSGRPRPKTSFAKQNTATRMITSFIILLFANFGIDVNGILSGQNSTL